MKYPGACRIMLDRRGVDDDVGRREARRGEEVAVPVAGRCAENRRRWRGEVRGSRNSRIDLCTCSSEGSEGSGEEAS